MTKRKVTKKYYFSVEGETEQWYLQWLEKLINSTPHSKDRVSFNCMVEKNPLIAAKKLTIREKTEIWHISDYESDEDVHKKEFMETIDNMAKAKSCGKNIEYKFGYTNLTFDLWIILHKMDCGLLPKSSQKRI
ncbi:MAG: hypothetical protein ATN34_02455 [Epulopiscium sp. Nele67-Bin002]|nr:MAG: hypothetical protein ATN33_01755 [Epulopiscium sp. Nele67-Bin001]OON92623.1 MAG: hypothetical protein ATN34_02455 [Epulopiscium sp. Nele67-Bin002]